jgi:hypothetical protein
MKLLLLRINPLVPKERNSISFNLFMEQTQLLLRMTKKCPQKENKGCISTKSLLYVNLQHNKFQPTKSWMNLFY